MSNNKLTVEIYGKRYVCEYDFGPGPDGIPMGYWNCGHCLIFYGRKNGWLTRSSIECKVCGAKVVK